MLDAQRNHPMILVVEDEVLVRICAVDQLECAGFGVIEACDGEEALRTFDEHPEVTTVFTDINMPGAFDGLALAFKIFGRHPQVQLILTSGRGEPLEMPPGAQFLLKPYNFNSLTTLINAA
jgi:two-component system, response regulator PdtaR